VFYVPPMAAADGADVQQCQRFDNLRADRLRNRQRFAGAVPVGRGLSTAVAGSVRTLGVRQIFGFRWVAAFGSCAGDPVCLC